MWATVLLHVWFHREEGGPRRPSYTLQAKKTWSKAATEVRGCRQKMGHRQTDLQVLYVETIEPRQSRTGDPQLKRLLLYQLS
jgi:hypothetical protein